MPDDELEVIDNEDELTGDEETVEVPDDEELLAEPAEFLRVDDRTVYKTPEAAKAGFTETRRNYLEARRQLDSLKDYGTPEEIATRLQMLDRITGRPKGTSEDMDDPLAGLDDAQKAQWQAYWKRNEKQLKAAGYIHQDELPGRIEQVVEQRERIRDAHTEFSRLAKDAGLEFDAETLEALDNAAVTLANKQNEFGQELRNLWHSPGGQAEFARKVFGRLYGKLAQKPKEPAPKPAAAAEEQRQRDQNGRYERVKRKTEQLPKTAKTGTAAKEGTVDERQKLATDPKHRRSSALAFLRQRRGEAA